MKLSVEALKFDERGLLPAVVQDARTREVLTVAYVNAESLRRTVESGETWFWSRSRAQLWHKGETSGHTQRVVGLSIDCDADAAVILVEPTGPACHTGARTCFHHEIEGASALAPGAKTTDDDEPESRDETGLGALLARLYALIETRRRERPENSYTTYLFDAGLDKILKKVGEESAETIVAAKNTDPRALAAEVSDLVYHLLVLLVERGLTLEDVRAELARREGEKGVMSDK